MAFQRLELAFAFFGAALLLFASGRAAAVIDGEPAKRGDFAATGVLMVSWPSGPALACNGTLITPSVVLTAAHCMRPVKNRPLLFSLAEEVSPRAASDGVAVRQVVIHPDFVVSTKKGQALHDLALVLLEQPVKGVVPARLLGPNEAAKFGPGAKVDLVGYGRTSRSNDSRGRKHLGRARIAEKRELEWLVGAPEETQNCDGDSGGPSYANIAGERILVGIVSRAGDDGNSCNSGTVHTRVDAEAAWIASTLARLSSRLSQ